MTTMRNTEWIDAHPPGPRPDGRCAVVPLLAPYFLLLPGDRTPPATSPGLPCPIAYGDSSFRTWLRDPREQGTDLGLPVPTVAAEGTDRRQLAGLCPACDGLGIHPEHGRHLCRREQRLGLGRACGHMYGLPFLDRYCDPAWLLPGSAGSLSWMSYMAH